jgi:TolA-binding protein
MNKPSEFPENLGTRARRGALCPDEQLDFERLLQSSATLRAAYQLGLDFDRIDTVQAGDEARVNRWVSGALRSRKRRRLRFATPNRRTTWLLAAAVFGFCGVAFGIRGTWLPILASRVLATAKPPEPKLSATTPGTGSHRRRASETTRLASDAATKETLETDAGVIDANRPVTVPASVAQPSNMPERFANVEPASVLPAPRSSVDAIRTSSSATFAEEGHAESGAALLLRQANAARRAGELKHAVALFRELQQKHGGSSEAVVSHVSLGKLLMNQGAAEAALQEFSAYLFVGGPLEEEALSGRAQALSALGRSREERSTWEALIARFPGSVYGARARERVRVLSDETPR